MVAWETVEDVRGVTEMLHNIFTVSRVSLRTYLNAKGGILSLP